MRQFWGRVVWVMCWGMSFVISAGAQPADISFMDGDLRFEDVVLTEQIDIFGTQEILLQGRILNAGDVPYSLMDIVVDALNEEGDSIGEGYGFAVDACGVALFDVPVQPDRHIDFSVKMDFDEASVRVDELDWRTWDILLSAQPQPDTLMPAPDLPEGIAMITDAEVVAVEWLDDTLLRYGVGCYGDFVLHHAWASYNLADGGITPLDVYPNAVHITDEFVGNAGINILTQGQIVDESLLERSFLTFPTQSERVVWQDDINNIFTTERDGRFKRAVHPRLAIYSLQGFVFSPAGNFVAYYFGASAEPVRWFTASMSGTLISTLIDNNPLSQTVPGLTNDAQRVIISGDYEQGMGYYLQSASRANSRQFLFGVDELAGNNYPAPAYRLVDNNTRYIYVIRPDAGETVLECYHLEANTLHRLTSLPFSLGADERAWSWLSPSGEQLAISANGRQSGAWVVDLTAFGVCQPQ